MLPISSKGSRLLCYKIKLLLNFFSTNFQIILISKLLVAYVLHPPFLKPDPNFLQGQRSVSFLVFLSMLKLSKSLILTLTLFLFLEMSHFMKMCFHLFPIQIILSSSLVPFLCLVFQLLILFLILEFNLNLLLLYLMIPSLIVIILLMKICLMRFQLSPLILLLILSLLESFLELSNNPLTYKLTTATRYLLSLLAFLPNQVFLIHYLPMFLINTSFLLTNPFAVTFLPLLSLPIIIKLLLIQNDKRL